MSFFPQAHISSDSSFHPLFRFIDDFDQFSRGGASHFNNRHHDHLNPFTPKFDVREVQSGYELHGELPGIEQKNVEIEFNDGQTLTIKGRTERAHTTGAPSAAEIEDGKVNEAIEEKKDHQHGPTVEDEAGEGSNQAVATTPATLPQTAKQSDEAKYWVSERSVGTFSRSFSFPDRVDQDSVRASMNNGVLSILVPKAKKAESRRINIE